MREKTIGVLFGMLTALLVLFALNVSSAEHPARVYALAPTRSVQLSNNGIMCDRPDENTGDCITIWNGGGLSLYNNPGSGLMFSIAGSSGNVNTNGSLTVRNTPVTNQVQAGATPVAAKVICKEVTVLGSATVTAAGITTPVAVTYGLGANPSANGNMVNYVNAAGVVTVSVWGAVATPATTDVPVSVCITGN